MAVPHPIPEPLAALIARRLRVIGDPMRLRLLDQLRERDGGMTVGELTTELGTSQQNVSKHLGVLHDAGIVDRAKHGTSVRYAIADVSVLSLCDQVCGGLRTRAAALDHILTGGTP